MAKIKVACFFLGHGVVTICGGQAQYMSIHICVLVKIE